MDLFEPTESYDVAPHDDETGGEPTQGTQGTEITSALHNRLQQLHQLAASEAAMAKDVGWSADTAENFRRALAVLQQQSMANGSSAIEIHTEIDAALAMSRLLCKCMGVNPEQRKASVQILKTVKTSAPQIIKK